MNEQVFVERSRGGANMAIAPMPQQEEMDLFEMPWPKPSLRLVSTPLVQHETFRRTDGVSRGDITALPVIRNRPTVERRRRLLLGLVAVAMLVLLALPLQALGGITATGKTAPGGVPSGLVDGTLYVVQPGDTVASVAHQLNPSGNQAVLQSEIREVVGSSVLVPGEHLLLP